MTYGRIKAIHGADGWTYHLGDRIPLGPKCAADVLHFTYGLTYRDARDKLEYARKGAIVNLPEPRRVDA